MHFRVSVPGKVILHGEHAVVYGMAAIASTINLRTEVTVESLVSHVVLELMSFDDERFKWRKAQFDDLERVPFGKGDIPEPTPEVLSFLHKAFKLSPEDRLYKSRITFIFLYAAMSFKYPGKSVPVKLTVSSQLPIGAGLGSSAAYSVAIAACILKAFGVIETVSGVPSEKELHLISNWAFQSEVICHGKPSGIDNSICTFGGALLFQKGAIKERNTSIPLYRVLVVDTQVPRDTKKLVAGVRARYDKYGDVIESVLETIDEISLQSWKNLKSKKLDREGQYRAAADLIAINHQLLNALGVGHPKLEEMVALAKQHDLSAKATGAGGGGCGFVLVDILDSADKLPPNQDSEALKAELEARGMVCYQVAMGCPGVTFESSK